MEQTKAKKIIKQVYDNTDYSICDVVRAACLMYPVSTRNITKVLKE